jgi:hypothetical protein
MNVRLTIDVPVRFLTGLEAALAARNLVIRPFIKNGQQRWELRNPAIGDREPALPGTIFGSPEVKPLSEIYEEIEARARA